jgi:mannitol-1-/sugar-/sorbitol-6-phosphatase
MPTLYCSAILFDLDGVLVDSTRSVSRQWRSWGAEHNIASERVLEIAHGVRTIEVVRLLTPHLDAEAEVKKIEQREANDTDGVVVMPGAAELLESLPGGRWAVVTSGTRYLATSRLRLADLPIPRVLISAEDVKKGKPDPEPYLMGARLLGVNPADCLAIEDAPAGIRSGHAGGMKVIALASTYAASQLKEADLVVDTLHQIRVIAQDRKLRVDA